MIANATRERDGSEGASVAPASKTAKRPAVARHPGHFHRGAAGDPELVALLDAHAAAADAVERVDEVVADLRSEIALQQDLVGAWFSGLPPDVAERVRAEAAEAGLSARVDVVATVVGDAPSWVHATRRRVGGYLAEVSDARRLRPSLVATRDEAAMAAWRHPMLRDLDDAARARLCEASDAHRVAHSSPEPEPRPGLGWHPRCAVRPNAARFLAGVDPAGELAEAVHAEERARSAALHAAAALACEGMRRGEARTEAAASVAALARRIALERPECATRARRTARERGLRDEDPTQWVDLVPGLSQAEAVLAEVAAGRGADETGRLRERHDRLTAEARATQARCVALVDGGWSEGDVAAARAAQTAWDAARPRLATDCAPRDRSA